MTLERVTYKFAADMSAFARTLDEATAATNRLSLVLLRRRFADLLRQLLQSRMGEGVTE